MLLQLGEASGFPDASGSYALVVERAAGARQIVMEGTAQRTSIAHQVVAERLPSGALGVAWFRTVCLTTDVATRCVDLDREAPPSLMVEALRWRIEHTRRSPYDCVPAALALAHHDPAGALPLLEALEGAVSDPMRDAELRAVLARVRDDADAVAVIEAELPSAHNPELVGFARACIPTLAAPLRAELVRRPAVTQAAVHEALRACP